VTGAGSAIIASSWPHQAGFPFKATICALSRSRAPGGQFVLHAKALPGNPYDGHTLGAVIEATERRDTADDTANFFTTKSGGMPLDHRSSRGDDYRRPAMLGRVHPEWLHEIELDGFRMMVRRDPAGVRLLTRNGYDWTGRFPRIAAAVEALRARSFLIDGEAVACDGDGLPVFDRLRSAQTRQGYRGTNGMTLVSQHFPLNFPTKRRL
jgi:ATP dependent DNA ligase-like protein